MTNTPTDRSARDPQSYPAKHGGGGGAKRIAPCRVIAGCVGLIAVWAVAAASVGSAIAIEPGDVVARFTFDDEAAKTWEGTTQPGIDIVSTEAAGSVLQVSVDPDEASPTRMIRTSLPAGTLRGARLRVTYRARAESVGTPPKPYNGVKCMIVTDSPSGRRWQHLNNLHGTFDWRSLGFMADIPRDVTDVTLMVGLESAPGRVWFDDITIKVDALRRRTPPVDVPPGTPVFKGHDVERLRGVMTGHEMSEQDLRDLSDWRANHIRWQLIWGGFPRSPADNAPVEEYFAWLEGQLERMDALLPICRELGIHVLIDVHTPPGGRNDSSECRMFHEREYQEAFIEVWDRIATRYRDEVAVWGYDLVNEPVEGIVPEGLMRWQELAETVSRRVRRIDPDHAIVVEPAPWGSPDSLEWLEPIDVPKVVYSVHMYKPHAFTHQGVRGSPVGLPYPGEIDGRYYDQDALRQILEPVVAFQRDYHVHIYIGEFSAIRWAPGDSAYNYLRDCIEIFEENGWDWAYHAFREWDGWSVEHGPDPDDHQPSSEPTKRQRLLMSWFDKCHQPAWAGAANAAGSNGQR